MTTDVFVPHAHCTVASGECFERGECLSACKEQHTRDQDKRIVSLETRVLMLEQEIYQLKAATQKY